jgi:hypothetical protein
LVGVCAWAWDCHHRGVAVFAGSSQLNTAIVAFLLFFGGSQIDEINITIRMKHAPQEISLPVLKPTKKVWRQVREPVQLGGGIDDGYELVDE